MWQEEQTCILKSELETMSKRVEELSKVPESEGKLNIRDILFYQTFAWFYSHALLVSRKSENPWGKIQQTQGRLLKAERRTHSAHSTGRGITAVFVIRSPLPEKNNLKIDFFAHWKDHFFIFIFLFSRNYV